MNLPAALRLDSSLEEVRLQAANTASAAANCDHAGNSSSVTQAAQPGARAARGIRGGTVEAAGIPRRCDYNSRPPPPRLTVRLAGLSR